MTAITRGQYVKRRVCELGRVAVWIVRGRIKVVPMSTQPDRVERLLDDPKMAERFVGIYDERMDETRCTADCRRVEEE